MLFPKAWKQSVELNANISCNMRNRLVFEGRLKSNMVH